MPVTIVRKPKNPVSVVKETVKKAQAKTKKPKSEPKAKTKAKADSKPKSTKKYDPTAKVRNKVKNTAVRVNMSEIDRKFEFDVFNNHVVVSLSSVNDQNIKVYTVYALGMFVGRLETMGGEHVACKTIVPVDYSDLMSDPRITPTGHSMKDGCYLLLRHAGLLLDK